MSTGPFGTTARWRVMGALMAFFLVLVAAPPIMSGSPRLGGFIGRYAFAGPESNPKRVFIDLDVSPGKDGKLTVGFGAGHADGSGAAPDGGGSGVVGDGVLRFDYEDSFANKGAGTLRRTKTGAYRLSIDIEDVQDSRCLVFYGQHLLKRSQDTR